MARVTVEKCMKDRFKLVLLAAKRARELGAGSPPQVERKNDKSPIVALREIEGGYLDLDRLEDDLIRSHQHVVEMEEEEDFDDVRKSESLDLLADDQNWVSSDEFEKELSEFSQIEEAESDQPASGF